jgi:uncharacterized protein (TIRG00374 family)
MPVRNSRRKFLTQVLIYVIAAACLVWVFRGTSARQLKHSLSLVSWPYFLLAALFNASVYFANAWRWKILLSPVTRVRYRRTLQAIYVGLFLNDVLPLRPGEIVRCGLLSRWARGLRFPVALSSITIERLVEGAVLQIGFIAVVLFTPVPRSLTYACAIVSLALVAVSMFLFWAVKRSQATPGTSSTNRLAEGWRRFVNGIHLMATARNMVPVIALSLAGLLLYVLATWALMKTCRILLPLTTAAAVLIITRIGTVIPTTPGSIGAYQFFSVLGLKLFGVTKAAAVPFTVVAFGTFTFPLLLGGALAFIIAGSDYSEISSVGNRHATLQDQPASPP